MLLQLWSKKQSFVLCDKGATAIEYGLIAAGIAVAISAAVFAFGSSLNTLFSGLSSTIAPTT